MKGVFAKHCDPAVTVNERPVGEVVVEVDVVVVVEEVVVEEVEDVVVVDVPGSVVVVDVPGSVVVVDVPGSVVVVDVPGSVVVVDVPGSVVVEEDDEVVVVDDVEVSGPVVVDDDDSSGLVVVLEGDSVTHVTDGSLSASSVDGEAPSSHVSVGEPEVDEEPDELDEDEEDESEEFELCDSEPLDELADRFEWLPEALASAIASGAISSAPVSAMAPAAAMRLRRSTVIGVRTGDLPYFLWTKKRSAGRAHLRNLDDFCACPVPSARNSAESVTTRRATWWADGGKGTWCSPNE